MSEALIEKAALSLREAERTRTPIAPLSAESGLDEEEAYGVQIVNARAKEASGDAPVGYKIGLTSKEAQVQFGVFQPDFGHLFESMRVVPDGEIDLNELIQPKIEAEVAFVMGADVKGPGIAAEDLESKIDSVRLALEIVDCRYSSWKISRLDLVADNGASSRFVLSPFARGYQELDLPSCGLALHWNGNVWVTGSGAAVMGHPLNALVFLVNEMGRRGKILRAGDIVLSGAITKMLTPKIGDRFLAEMAELGELRVKFTGGEGK